MPRIAPLNTRRIHICVGAPQLDALKQLETASASRTPEFDWWNITQYARSGDTAIFYLTAPISAFVATGIVGRIADDVPPEDQNEYFGPHCFWMSDAEMLPRAVTLDEVKTRFPGWKYPKRPGVSSIPNENTPVELVEEFVLLLKIPPRPTQEASDTTEPPPRIPAHSYRILRDTPMAREVKRKHAYKCQICSEVIELPDGSLYAEAHHIVPLGGKHNSLDVPENILCLCPNHHAELDYCVRGIELAELRCADGHWIEQKYVDYHNAMRQALLQRLSECETTIHS